MDSRFAMSDIPLITRTDAFCALGRQDGTTLCTTAGQNLTAVSSSHSLTETVDLGSVTAAGLVGTLHGIHLLNLKHMLNSLLTVATHKN